MSPRPNLLDSPGAIHPRSPPITDFADLPEPAQALLREVHLRAHDAIRQAVEDHGRGPGLATAIAEARVAVLDREMAPIFEAMAASPTPVACARGCAACCTLTVEITPDEAIAAARHLEAILTPEALADVKARARDKVARSAGLDPAARHALRLQCVALDRASGACLVHPVRPAPCQGYLSLDRAKCEADHAGPPVPIPQPAAADLVRDAVMSAQQIVLEDAGLAQGRRELTEALLAVWDTAGNEARWSGT